MAERSSKELESLDTLQNGASEESGWTVNKATLSLEEVGIFQAADAGKTISEIADLLQISTFLADLHLQSAKAKLLYRSKMSNTALEEADAPPIIKLFSYLLTEKFTIDPVPPMIDRVAGIIGDREEAMRWLGTPIRGLDFATPISLLATAEGQRRVINILGQMEHGIW